jgi:GDP-mannose 6-dehydrogenase
MVKYACNSFHALKVTLPTRLAHLQDTRRGQSQGDGRFCQDTKLNLSPYYLKPGFAFGGSCLPKDVRALTYKARTLDLETPLLNSLLVSNRLQIERAAELVAQTGKKQIAFSVELQSRHGRLRESPTVTLIELLLGKGYKLSIYDKEVELARIFGANRQYIEREIPHISSLMREDIHQVIEAPR